MAAGIKSAAPQTAAELDVSRLPKYMTTCFPFVRNDEFLQHPTLGSQSHWSTSQFQGSDNGDVVDYGLFDDDGVTVQSDALALANSHQSQNLFYHHPSQPPLPQYNNNGVLESLHGSCLAQLQRSTIVSDGTVGAHQVVQHDHYAGSVNSPVVAYSEASTGVSSRFTNHAASHYAHGDYHWPLSYDQQLDGGISYCVVPGPLQSNKVNVGVQNDAVNHRRPHKPSARRRTIICKDCEVQTDFADELADLSLADRPSSLYQNADSACEEVHSSPKTTRRKRSDALADMSSILCSHLGCSSRYLSSPVMSNGGTISNSLYMPRTFAAPLYRNSPLVSCRAADEDLMISALTKQQLVLDFAQKNHSIGNCSKLDNETKLSSVGTETAPSIDVATPSSAKLSGGKSTAVVSAHAAANSKKLSNKGGKDAQLSRNIKKKQKRQAQLSRAADVELAEISLEQQVLQQLVQRRMNGLTQNSSGDVIDDSDSILENLLLTLTADGVPFVHHSALRTAAESEHSKLMLTAGALDARSETCLSPLSVSSDELPVNPLDSSMTGGFLHVDCSSGTKMSDGSVQSCWYSKSQSSSVADLSPVSQNSPLTLSTPSASPLSTSGLLSPSSSSHESRVVNQIHSRRFREYCNQVLSQEIDDCCTQLLQQLVHFQNCIDENQPSDTIKRRTVLGLREVTKFLRLHKLKAVIISPNLEKIQSKGGLDEALHSIIEMCQKQHVPFVFALGRRALGRACAKSVPVSVVGIFSYDGVESQFEQLQHLTDEARQKYRELVATLQQQQQSGTEAKLQ